MFIIIGSKDKDKNIILSDEMETLEEANIMLEYLWAKSKSYSNMRMFKSLDDQ